jgi:hypothetical protein
MEFIQIPVILLTTVLEKSYLAHLEQWLAGWQIYEWICMMESMQIPGILLSTVLGKSYQAQLGVIFDSSCATAAQAATISHESDRPWKEGSRTAQADL